MKYEDLLKDPRWQKRRLEIMQRDNFTCQHCGTGLNDGVPLNVHHLVYRRCNPWEYHDNELVTLCENCHTNTHNKNKKNKSTNKNNSKRRPQLTKINDKKIVYYRGLLKNCNKLTPNEKILYSFLIQRSLIDAFGFCDTSKLISNDGELIPLTHLNNSYLSRTLHLSRRTIITGLAKLEKLGYIRHNQYFELEIFVNKELLKSGYFELYNINQLSGELVVFYSYLVNKGQQYDYCIDTFKYRLAEDLGKTTTAITKLLHRLYRLGFAERLDNGKLLINKFGKLK